MKRIPANFGGLNHIISEKIRRNQQALLLTEEEPKNNGEKFQKTKDSLQKWEKVFKKHEKVYEKWETFTKWERIRQGGVILDSGVIPATLSFW